MTERLTVEDWKRSEGGKKTNKYGNKKTEYSGRLYDSKKEANRAAELDVLVRGGVVRNWQAQPRFHFQYGGVKICSYVADFRVEYTDGTVDIEDVKGYKTDVYKLKKKMMKAFYGIEIKEL